MMGIKRRVHGRGMGIVSGVGAFRVTPFFIEPVDLILTKNDECVPISGTMAMADPLKSAES